MADVAAQDLASQDSVGNCRIACRSAGSGPPGLGATRYERPGPLDSTSRPFPSLPPRGAESACRARLGAPH
eukprot:8394255-Pyramimonas_sp.AAC.1